MAILLSALLLLGGQLTPLLPRCAGATAIPCDSQLRRPVWRTFRADGTVTKLNTLSIRRAANGNVVATIYSAPAGFMFDARHLVEIVTDCHGMMAVQGTPDMAPPRGTIGGALMREMCRRR